MRACTVLMAKTIFFFFFLEAPFGLHVVSVTIYDKSIVFKLQCYFFGMKKTWVSFAWKGLVPAALTRQIIMTRVWFV